MTRYAEDTVLVVDDEPGHRQMLTAVLGDLGWDVLEAPDGEQALEILETTRPAAVILDMRMPGMDGLEVLARIRDQGLLSPVVLLTAHGSVGSAVEAMKQGAFDYLTKPADNDELEAVLTKAKEYFDLMRENLDLRRKVARSDAGPDIVGQTPGMLKVKEAIRQVGPSEATVLILGESGTGKELVAEALHAASPRGQGPLVRVNCAALPENLLESELFGYARGAFTGATRDKPGRFQLANGGTLFLDEIGELTPTLQAKLLRVLQERIVEPLGGVKPVPVDVRILAATHRDLKDLVARGEFREDLFYRLAVLDVRIPPLRDRKGDIPLLAGKLLARLAEKNRTSVRDVSPTFLEALREHDWPGNVRELENVLERALILARSDTLTPDLLPESVRRPETGPEPPEEIDELDHAPADADADDLDAAEKQALVKALKRHQGHRERTAQALGVSRRTLQYKLKKHGLTRR
jgi:two-component system NtrC family response regulator